MIPRRLLPILLLAACAPPAAAQRTVTAPSSAAADARVLERTIDVRVELDGRALRTERRVLEYFTDFGWETWGDPLLHHDARTQRLTVRTARTIEPDGTVQDTPAIGINELTTASLAAAPAFAALRETVVTLVGLQPGAKAELEYVIEDTAPPPGGQQAGTVALSASIPIDALELRVSVPANLPLRHACVACTLQPVVTEADGRRTYVWRAERLAPVNLLETTDHLGTSHDGLDGPRIVWSTAPDWAAAAAPLAAVHPPPDGPADAVVAQAERLAADAPTADQRVEALQAFVAEAIASVEPPVGLPLQVPAAPADVLGRSHGTRLEQAGLLVALLAAVDVPAEVVLAAPRGAVARDVPDPSQLPHAWVVVEPGPAERWLRVDEVAAPSPGGPPEPLDVLRLAAPAAGVTSSAVPAAADHVADARVELRLAEDGTGAGTVRLTLAGLHDPYAALRADGDDPAEALGDAAAKLVDGEATATRLTELSAARAAAEVEVELELAEEARDTRTLTLGWPGEDPLPASLYRGARETDLELGAPFRRSLHCELRLPDGWEAVIAPRNVRVVTEVGTFVQEVSVGGGRLTLTRTLELRGGRVSPTEYSGLRALRRAFVTAGAEPVVLRPAD
jgi:transglutaminase-like putative cysteine protease